MAPSKTNVSRKKKVANEDRRNIWLLIITTILLVASVWAFMPPQEKVNQGLDIQGGLSVVLTAKSTTGDAISDEEMEASRAIIENRVNALGASEAVVQAQGTDQILVQIPGLSDTQQALDTIGKTGKLEFARLDSFTDEEVKSDIQNGNYGSVESVSDEYGNSFVFNKNSGTGIAVEEGTYTPIVTGDNLTRVTIDRASEASAYYAVNLELDSAGAAAFAEASRDLAPTKGQIVIILDGEVQSAPAVQSEIPNGHVQITGNYDMEGAQSLKTVLESGSLPVSFEYSQSQVVGPTLGQDALASGVLVALIGLLLVMIYLLFFYKGLGTITAAAMVVFAVLYLGLLAGLSAFGLFSLSLSGVAGIVLTIGMAADSSVLTVERFREEVRMGRSVKAASQSGVKHAILTSIDADLVSLVSGLTLFFLASASVKGFGLTLVLGIACDVCMLLLFKAPLIRLIAPRTISKHPGFWGVRDCQEAAASYTELGRVQGVNASAAELGEALDWRESEEIAEKISGERGKAISKAVHSMKGRFIKHDINFMGKRKILLSISAVLVVSSMLFVGIRGLDFGIEFVGGTSVTFHETADISLDDMRSAVNEAGVPEATIQTTETNGVHGYLIRMTVTDAQEASAIADNVAEHFGLSADNYEVTTIGPDWGASVVNASLIAFLVSLVLIIIYIAIRFEFKMGVAVVIGLLHDLIIVVGVYALFGREITPNAIAAILALIGYSTYDSVVSLHRINENMKQGIEAKCSFMTMANHSLNQVIVRSMNTTITSLIPVLFMFFFGSETLQDFAFALVIGLIVGCYSSIAVATPIFSIWKESEPQYAKLRKKFGDVIGVFEFDRSQRGMTPVYASASAGDVEVSEKDVEKAKAVIVTASGESLDPADPEVYQKTVHNPNKTKKTRKQRKR